MPIKTAIADKPATDAANEAINRFQEEIEQALKHLHDPRWLGQNSPLATPYFLGDRLPQSSASEATNPLGRGQLLQALLRQSFAALAAQSDDTTLLGVKVLDATYFQPGNRSVQQISDRLGIGPATYHRHRNGGIAKLAQSVLQSVKPALRQETPASPSFWIGRELEVERCLQWLTQGKSVTVSGAGGVGKSALGVVVAQRFAAQTTFWYTFTPGFNDHLHSLLFALAWFLRGQGASTLWTQLIADGGTIHESSAVHLLRHDLSGLRSKQLLLCFDEVDLLRPSEVDAHTQIIPFLESLRPLTALLFMGQKPTVQSDFQLLLQGLPPLICGQLLQQHNTTLPEEELPTLHRYTGGNPRLLELFAALGNSLQRNGLSLRAALMTFASEPSLEFLVRRIWQHLNESEMYFLELLSVFRQAAPREVWSDQAQQSALDQLIEWRLVQADGQGGVRLLPALAETIDRTLLTSDEKELLHLEAAGLRAQYGQFSAAAYHYACAGEAQLALRLLHSHRADEINQGQAEAMLNLLQTIPARRLPVEDQEKLALLRAELQKLLGNYDEARKTLQTTYWRIPFLKAQAWRLEGDIAELRGEVSKAQDAYQSGLQTVEQLLVSAAEFHRDLGYLSTNDVDFATARSEVLRLRHEAANLEGFINERSSNLPAAAIAYEEARQFAQAASYAYGEANTQNNLGCVYAWRRQTALAEEHLQAAIEFFENTGRINKLASATYNLALARRLAGRYAEALTPAQESLDWFIRLGEQYGQAVANEILAEIHLGLGQLNEAEQFASKVIEIEHSSAIPDALRTLGEIRLHQGKLDEAEGLIRQSLALAQSHQDRVLEGYAWRALGWVQSRSANPENAQISFEHAVRLFAAAGVVEDVIGYVESASDQ